MTELRTLPLLPAIKEPRELRLPSIVSTGLRPITFPPFLPPPLLSAPLLFSGVVTGGRPAYDSCPQEWTREAAPSLPLSLLQPFSPSLKRNYPSLPRGPVLLPGGSSHQVSQILNRRHSGPASPLTPPLYPIALSERRTSVYSDSTHSTSAGSETDDEMVGQSSPDNGGGKVKKQRKRRRTAMEPPRDAHLRTHFCGECGKAFARPSALETHLRCHSRERPYSCPKPGCGRSFAVPSNLRRHQKLHERNETTSDPSGNQKSHSQLEFETV
ncbi:hypothetical protein T439DRAFT_321556 [Meredithblackwellia eburnea MCA 4105]